MAPNDQLPMTNYRPHPRFAFTLMEMMVAVSILVVIILSVGVIFKSASNAVGLSQSSLEMLSNVRGIQQQIERDVAGMDKNAFLVIRCSTFTDTTVTPSVVRRGDQISFIANGSFRNRTGTNQSGAAFTDSQTFAPSAFVWWGQVAVEKVTSTWTVSSRSNPTVYLLNTPGTKLQLDQVPTGIKDSDFILGRHTSLLFAKDSNGPANTMTPGGQTIASFPSNFVVVPPMAAIDYNNSTTVKAISTELASDVTQSRISAVQLTSSQLIGILMQTIGTTRSAANVRFEAEHYCYRYGILTSPYDSSSSLVDGFFRMHPIALQGVSSFAIDWSDGVNLFTAADIDPATGLTVDPSLVGTPRWYGASNTAGVGLAKGGTFVAGIVDPSGATPAIGPGKDSYTAIFSVDNRSQWPRSLRFRYHVADPTGRIPNGRDFVQVVKLPS